MSNVHDRVARLQARWKAVPNIEERKEPEGTDGNEQQQPQPQQQQQQQRRRRQQPQRQQQLQQQQRLQQAQYLHTRDASPHRAWNNSSRSLPAATPIVDFDSMEFAESTKVLVEDDASADLDIRSLNVAEPALLSRSRGAHSGFAASEASTKREVFDAAELLPPPLNLGPGLHQRVRNRVLKNFRDWVRENNRNVNRTDTQRRSLPGKFADIFTDKKFFRSFLKQQLRKSNAPVSSVDHVRRCQAGIQFVACQFAVLYSVIGNAALVSWSHVCVPGEAFAVGNQVLETWGPIGGSNAATVGGLGVGPNQFRRHEESGACCKTSGWCEGC